MLMAGLLMAAPAVTLLGGGLSRMRAAFVLDFGGPERCLARNGVMLAERAKA